MKRCGFTVVELMIAVAVAGILATLAIPVFNSYKYKVRMSEATTHLGALFHGQAAFIARTPAKGDRSWQGSAAGPNQPGSDSAASCRYPSGNLIGVLNRLGSNKIAGVPGAGCADFGFDIESPVYFFYWGDESDANRGTFNNLAMQDLDDDNLRGWLVERIVPNNNGELYRSERIQTGDFDFN